MIIGVHEGPNAELMDLIATSDGKLIDKFSMGSKCTVILADVPFGAISSFVVGVQATRCVLFVEPNMFAQADFIPNDSLWGYQWGPQKIEADWAWNTTTGDSSITVSVIDSGIHYLHPDLDGNYIEGGYDWLDDDDNPIDETSHGTAVAGVMAAEINNGIGIAGLAQVKIMAEKVFKPYHHGKSGDIANAIYHAVEQGADIINLSFGDYEDSELVREAIRDAYGAGVLLVASAGNDHTTSKNYPAAYDEVIAVAAADQFDDPWENTNLGDWVELAAPGVDVYSTFPSGEYETKSGTSVAAPHVAGTAALIWSQFPNMTCDRVRIHLRRTADDLGDPGFDINYGYGRVNARRAVEQIAPEHDLLIHFWEKPLRMQSVDSTVINATILNYGKRDEWVVAVELFVNDTVVNSQVIDVVGTGNSATVSLWWSPALKGMFNVTVRVIPVPDENDTKDNAVSAYVCVGGPTTIKVPDHYLTIVEAVDAAISGDVISVASGTYYDANTVIEKDNLTLVGENKETTIVDGVTFPLPPPERLATLKVSASNVTIQGFTILEGHYGIIVGSSECNGNVISGNIISQGILLNVTNNNIIHNNIVINSHSGLSLFSSHNNSIIANYIANNEEGIWLYESYGNIMRNNNLTGNPFRVQGEEVEHYINDIDFSNTLDGKPIGYLVNQHNILVPTDVAFMAIINCTKVLVKDANLSKINVLLFHTFDSIIENVTVQGINLKKSNGVLVNKCIIADANDGVFVYKSNNNTIANNVITENDKGIEIIFNAEFNKIVNNTISHNRIGVYLITSNKNTAYHNSFINNTHQTLGSTGGNMWDNGYPGGGNYWSDYDGTDLFSGPYQNDTGSDGIGDTPYVINAHNQDNYPLMSPFEYWGNPISGDINKDMKVDYKDLFQLATSYNSNPEEPNWNPNADLNSDAEINYEDLFILAANYGKAC